MDRYRHEYKYLVSSSQIEILKSRLKGLMSLDSHVGDSGIYNIRSLYFDDYFNRCFFENENGIDPREKFRIRIYNHNDERISLECKKKENGKTLKLSCTITKDQMKSLADGNAEVTNDNPELLNKLILDIKNNLMKPVVIVEYDRIPYVYKYGNVRVTFDTNISSSNDFKSFLSGNIVKRPIMPKGTQLMEVKWDDYLPDFIYRALQLENLETTAYSKYYLARKYNMKGM